MYDVCDMVCYGMGIIDLALAFVVMRADCRAISEAVHVFIGVIAVQYDFGRGVFGSALYRMRMKCKHSVCCTFTAGKVVLIAITD